MCLRGICHFIFMIHADRVLSIYLKKKFERAAAFTEEKKKMLLLLFSMSM